MFKLDFFFQSILIYLISEAEQKTQRVDKKNWSLRLNIFFYMNGPIIICRNYSSISVYFQFLNLEMVVLKVLREFAVGTSLHGFGFLVSPKSSSRTKIIWALSLIVAIVYASSEMRNSVISKYQHSFNLQHNDLFIMKFVSEPVLCAVSFLWFDFISLFHQMVI